jgi:hypothetical protein
VCDQFVVQDELHGAEPEVEDPCSDEQQCGEPARVLVAQERRDEHVGMRARPSAGDHLDQVVAAERERARIVAQRGVTDRHADPGRAGQARQSRHPVRAGRIDAHEDRTLHRSRGA